MKKILISIFTIVMTLSFLTGCTDPVYDDFENFLNTEMVDVNENYEKIKAEAGNWDNLEDDAALASSVKDVLLPIVDDSLAKLEKITPQTEEVTELKEKYIKVMEAYKEGFNDMLVAIQEVDENKMVEGNEKISKGIEYLDEYNKALEKLAEEVGAEIEY